MKQINKHNIKHCVEKKKKINKQIIREEYILLFRQNSMLN
jgi:hypothetical protein